jgi:hypothetical protein
LGEVTIMSNAFPDPAAWAARAVGLPPDATRAEIRAGLLREVTRDEFVPSPQRQQAWQIFSAPRDSTPAFPPAGLLVEEARLRGEIDDFAASFFATPIESRKRRWQELSRICAFSPPLTARLAALEPGLSLDLRLNDIDNPRMAQLASHVAGLFVLPLGARAVQRQAVLRTMQTDIVGWEEISRQLQAGAPALTALEPTLLTAILGWREQQQRLAQLRAGRQSSGRLPTVRRAPAPSNQPAPSDTTNSGRAIGCVGMVVIWLVVRACIGGLGSHSSVAPPPKFEAPRFEAPKFDPQGPERTRKMLEELQELERLNRQIEEQNKLTPQQKEEQLRREVEEFKKQREAQPGGVDPATRRGP